MNVTALVSDVSDPELLSAEQGKQHEEHEMKPLRGQLVQLRQPTPY